MEFSGFSPTPDAPPSPTASWAGAFCHSPHPAQPRLARALSDCSNSGSRPPRSPSPLAAALRALSPLPSPGKLGYAIPRPRLYPQAALEGRDVCASPAPSAWCVFRGGWADAQIGAVTAALIPASFARGSRRRAPQAQRPAHALLWLHGQRLQQPLELRGQRL
jgi:hypothetical protein